MFVAGDLERDAEIIESLIAVLEAARVARCPSQNGDPRPVRFGTIEFLGRSSTPEAALQPAGEIEEPW